MLFALSNFAAIFVACSICCGVALRSICASLGDGLPDGFLNGCVVLVIALSFNVPCSILAQRLGIDAERFGLDQQLLGQRLHFRRCASVTRGIEVVAAPVGERPTLEVPEALCCTAITSILRLTVNSALVQESLEPDEHPAHLIRSAQFDEGVVQRPILEL